MKNNLTKEQKDYLTRRARELRHNATNAEKLMWSLLRDRQFFGVKFRRQHRIGNYITDFASTKHKLIIELDGGQHAPELNGNKDTIRTAYLENQGWQVLRFWNNEVLQNLEGVAHAIAVTLTPALSLSEGEGAKATSEKMN